MRPSRAVGHVAPALPGRRCERLMWITPQRVFYHGLLGVPAVRTMGSVIVYSAVEGALRVRIADGDWQTTTMAVVHPYVPHQVIAQARLIDVVMLEAETIDPAALPEPLQRSSAVDAPELLDRIRGGQQRLAWRNGAPEPGLDFDLTFLGRPVAPRRLDPRIALVAERIRREPNGTMSAQQHAQQVNLSFSRFLHLFKDEVGVPFRSFRAWKRARDLLHYVNRISSLTQVALEAGYPDSTHFSHSIRQAYGLKPSDIFAGSRRLVIFAQHGEVSRAGDGAGAVRRAPSPNSQTRVVRVPAP